MKHEMRFLTALTFSLAAFFAAVVASADDKAAVLQGYCSGAGGCTECIGDPDPFSRPIPTPAAEPTLAPEESAVIEEMVTEMTESVARMIGRAEDSIAVSPRSGGAVTVKATATCPASAPAPGEPPTVNPKVAVACPPRHILGGLPATACGPEQMPRELRQAGVQCAVYLDPDICKALGYPQEGAVIKIDTWSEVRKWLEEVLASAGADETKRRAIVTALHELLHCYLMACKVPPCEQEQTCYNQDKDMIEKRMKELGCQLPTPDGGYPSISDPPGMSKVCHQLRRVHLWSIMNIAFNDCVCKSATEAECKNKCVGPCKTRAFSDPKVRILPEKCDEMARQYCKNAARRPL